MEMEQIKRDLEQIKLNQEHMQKEQTTMQQDVQSIKNSLGGDQLGNKGYAGRVDVLEKDMRSIKHRQWTERGIMAGIAMAVSALKDLFISN